MPFLLNPNSLFSMKLPPPSSPAAISGHLNSPSPSLSMEESDQRSKRRPFCSVCTKPSSVCLCSRFKTPKMDNSISITILQHVQEKNHALNSSRIALLGLKNVDIAPVSDIHHQARFLLQLKPQQSQSKFDSKERLLGDSGETQLGNSVSEENREHPISESIDSEERLLGDSVETQLGNSVWEEDREHPISASCIGGSQWKNAAICEQNGIGGAVFGRIPESPDDIIGNGGRGNHGFCSMKIGSVETKKEQICGAGSNGIMKSDSNGKLQKQRSGFSNLSSSSTSNVIYTHKESKESKFDSISLSFSEISIGKHDENGRLDVKQACICNGKLQNGFSDHSLQEEEMQNGNHSVEPTENDSPMISECCEVSRNSVNLENSMFIEFFAYPRSKRMEGQHSVAKHGCTTPDIVPILDKAIAEAAIANGFVVKKFNGKLSEVTEKYKEIDEFEIAIPPGAALLFPTNKATGLGSIDVNEVKHLIVLDGTWGKAKRIYHENPWLQLLPHLKLETEEMSLYSEVRQQPQVGCLSTIESIVSALKSLGEDFEGLDGLLDVFKSMVSDQRRCKAEKRANCRNCDL